MSKHKQSKDPIFDMLTRMCNSIITSEEDKEELSELCNVPEEEYQVLKRKMGEEVLEEALNIINGHRQDDYGSPEDSFQNIANYWNAYFEQIADKREDGLTPEDVAMMMILFKIARLGHGYTRDSVVDICGYAAIYAAMHGD